MKSSAVKNLTANTPSLLTEKEAADYLAISPGTLAVWRSTGRYNLPFVKVGHSVRYRFTDLDSWIKSRERATGATE